MKTTKTVVQNDGKFVTYFTENGIWRKAFECGEYAWGKTNFKHVQQLVKQFKGDKPNVVVDVGASIGAATLQYSNWADKVVSFEPCDSSRHVLLQNIQQNNIKNVYVESVGLSDIYCISNLQIIGGNESMNFITENASARTVPVRLISFDDWVVDKAVIYDFIKVDVEGLEMKVLLGMVNTIKRHQPVFQIEMKDKWLKRNNTSSEEIWDFFNNRGYKCFSSPTKIVERELVASVHRQKADLYFVKTDECGFSSYS